MILPLTEVAYRNKELTENREGLIINEKCIMYRYEKDFIKKGVRLVCERIRPKTVVEFGFGYGYTADEFQDYGIRKHIIIEAHPEIYNRAIQWKRKKLVKNPNLDIEVIYDFWQNVVLNFEVDLIYHDTYEMVYVNRVDNFSGYDYKWFANAYCDIDEEHRGIVWPKDFIEFELHNEKKVQLLRKIQF